MSFPKKLDFFFFSRLILFLSPIHTDKMPGLDLNNLPERIEDINFDDIYEKHHVPLETDFDTIVVVDGAPIVDEAKEGKLITVLTKLFAKGAGEIKENGIWMPMTPNEEGKKTSSG